MKNLTVQLATVYIQPTNHEPFQQATLTTIQIRNHYHTNNQYQYAITIGSKMLAKNV